MSHTVFQALDNAVECGGTSLAAKALVGTGKAGAALLDEMCSSGLLEKAAGRTPKYNLTPKGREAWEREAPEGRRQQVRQREQERQRRGLVVFLAAVEKKEGKALTKPELTRFPDSARQEACDRALAEPGPKANCYRLLPAGQELLLGELPAKEQLERLRQISGQAAAAWRAAQQRLARDLGQSAGEALRAKANEVAERADKARQTLDAALAELAGLAGVAEAARQVREEVEAASRSALQTVESEKVRLAEAEARLRREAAQQREQLEAFERRVEERVAELARRLDETKPVSAAEPAPRLDGPPPDATVWEAARAAHERLRQENLRAGGIVKVPELTDAVLRSAGGLSPAGFHDLLRRWQQEDRLTLQLCNDPRLEPRAAEGIQSPRGLLFYVQMR